MFPAEYSALNEIENHWGREDVDISSELRGDTTLPPALQGELGGGVDGKVG